MKKVFFLFILLLISSSVCLALTTDDNGYAWKAASYEEKIAVCKELTSTIGKDYTYWIDMFNAFYDNNNWNIKSLKIKEVAVLMPFSEQPPGQ
ncbi:MAG: hypothetical protein KKH57_08100 [Candidatus Omnitrophica bacterium]|nr:hypothetical protein [Candidatus Omnitrophota bacterium]